MPIQEGDVLRVTAKMTYEQSGAIQNVFYVKHTGTQDVAEFDFMEAAAAWLDAAWTEPILLFVDELKFDEVAGYNITQDDPLLPEPWPVLIEGGTAGQSSALQVALLVSFQTTVKRSQGRKYLGGIDQLQYDGGGLWKVNVEPLVNDWADIIINGFVVGIETFEVGHVSSVTLAWVPWARYSMDPIARTQRRRVLGVGI